MIVPQKIFCTLCTNEIKDGAPVIQIPVPVSATLRKELVAYVEQQILSKRVPQSPISAMLAGADAMVPTMWKVEVCHGCLFGLMPDLPKVVAAEIRERLANSMKARERNEAVLREIDIDA